MTDKVNAAREETRRALADDADVSYITEELLNEIENSDAEEITANARSIQVEGNTFTVSDGFYWWRPDCTVGNWKKARNATAVRVVNCANGLLHYRITVISI